MSTHPSSANTYRRLSHAVAGVAHSTKYVAAAAFALHVASYVTDMTGPAATIAVAMTTVLIAITYCAWVWHQFETCAIQATNAEGLDFDAPACALCMTDYPADAVERTQQRLPLLSLTHFLAYPSVKLTLFVVVVGLQLLPDWCEIHGAHALLFVVPSDLLVLAVIYLLSTHHPHRPWCPFCGHWDGDDDDDVEASPQPTLGRGAR